MIRTLTIGLIAFAAIVSSSLLSSGSADTPDDHPEFYFTRLVYTQNVLAGFFGGGTMAKPDPYLCPEFGGGNFFPAQGFGWATDTPGADCKLMGAIHRLTGQRVHPNPNYVEILDDDLFKYPYAYIVEPGGLYLNSREAARLREYLLRGGFLHLDDFWGLEQKQNVIDEFAKVFPDRPITPIPRDHPLFHTFFDIEEILQAPNQGNGCSGDETWEQPDDKLPRVYGITDDDGRLMVVITYNSDLGDAWEYMDLACYPERFSHYAIRMALNSMIYAMTH